VDGQVVRLDKPLAEVADQFVRVRLVKIAGADLNTFEFDYDLTWFVFFLNADETIYGRYGGRDASDAEARISLKGLRYAMDRALETHKAPPPAAKAAKPLLAEKYDAAKSHKGCIHCHNIKEFRRADEKKAGTWTRDSLWVYPLPENVGLTLDVDVGNRVKTVTKDSAAAKAGLAAGDFVTRIGETNVASFADAIYGLHKSPAVGDIPIRWTRDGKELSAKLAVAGGWRRTNLTWRPSLLDILPSLPFNGDDLTAAEKKKLGLDEKRAAFRQDKTVHRTLREAGIEPLDIVIGFDGKSAEGEYGNLLGFVRRNYLVGDVVTVNVIRDGKPTAVKLTLK
jgi:serine protease Do